ncbi:MAG: hypothetical protein ACT4PG_09375 [Panacagrimonas sp.]
MAGNTADEKALALNFAYTALVRALCKNGALTLDQLMFHLAGATQRLDQIGESGAAAMLGAMAEGLQAVDE